MDRRTRMTKTMLAKALIDMLKEQDIHKISIRELCERADVNRSTFYKYYGSQYELFDEVEKQIVDKIVGALREKAAKKDYFEAMKSLLIIMNDNIEMARLLHINKPDLNICSKILSIIDAERDVYAEIKDIPEHLKPQVYNFYKIGAYRIICGWIVKEDRSDIDEVAGLLLEMRNRLYKN